MSDPTLGDVRIVKIMRAKARPIYTVYYIEFGAWVRSPNTYTSLKPAIIKAREIQKILSTIDTVDVYALGPNNTLIPVDLSK